MTISPELFMAILSMDSYNRGYDAGISGLSESGGLGSATITTTLSDVSETFEAAAQAAGFYAVASQWNGETVMSYRGTDNDSIWGNPWTSPGDICSGWLLGGGTRRPRPRHPRAPTLGSIPLSHRTMLQVEGSRNGSSARGARMTRVERSSGWQ